MPKDRTKGVTGFADIVDMRNRLFCTIIVCLLLLIPPAAFASGPAEVPYANLLKEASNLFENKQWDRSESIFLKATQSPLVDERIRAYEGLVTLYGKLKLRKKAVKAKTGLNEEKTFLESLVPQDDFYYDTYTIRKGDTYAKLAKTKRVSLEWLKRANNARRLVAGSSMRVPRVNYMLIVDKSEKKLFWILGADILKAYPISVGREGMESPEGEFTIVNKVMNPVWYKMKEQYPPDSPENLLGTRWMGLNIKGYGIHGTKRPGNIGKAVSHGCIRLLNAHVEELFQWIPVGTRVVIEGSIADKTNLKKNDEGAEG